MRYTSSIVKGFAVCFLVLPSLSSAQIDVLRELTSRVESSSNLLTVDFSVVTASGVCTRDYSMTPSPAIYHAASISKLFTAVVIFQLKEEKLLTLDDPVRKYLSVFDDNEILIRHLLTHTSGLRDRRRADGRTTDEQVADYIQSIAAQRVRSPGARWRYADANFNVLASIIEQITNIEFSAALNTRILTPAGMIHSGFDAEKFDSAQLISSYSRRGREQDHPWDRAFMGSAGLQTTAVDLAQFAQALLASYNEESGAILSRAALLEMVEVQTETQWEGVFQGYGWQLSHNELGEQWRHAGGEDGFESLFTLYPEAGIAVAVLGNQEEWPRFETERDLRQLTGGNSELCSRK